MLESLSIRNLGVIAQADLDFVNGFNVLSGETGAGKTMVLTALNLLMGGRADSSLVRTGQQQLQVSCSLRLTSKDAVDLANEFGAEIDAGRIVISRSVGVDGRSRAILGGLQVPAGALSQMTADLIAVHGQADQQRLRSNAAQLAALDDYGNYGTELQAYQQSYQLLHEAEVRLQRLTVAGEFEHAKLTQLRERLHDIEGLSPEKDELEEISQRILRLSNVESLRTSATLAHDALSSDGELDALLSLGAARKALENSSDPFQQSLGQQIKEIASTAQDVATALASYLMDLDGDPAQLEQLYERRALLVALERRYGKSLNELIASIPSMKSEIMNLDSSEDQTEKLEVHIEALRSQVAQAARELHNQRKATAKELSLQVTAEMRQLALAGSKLDIQVSTQDEFDSSGSDKVEFMLTSFSGAEARQVSKGASGGELSRIMLALELVISGGNAPATMVFDEVDAGVGGQAAVELGSRLQKVSRSSQVIVVTHLAQVAAYADHHIVVTKNSDGSITESQVQAVTQEARVTELARMLSGQPDSQVALEHARELLENR